jgi:hypothetical protein
MIKNKLIIRENIIINTFYVSFKFLKHAKNILVKMNLY